MAWFNWSESKHLQLRLSNISLSTLCYQNGWLGRANIRFSAENKRASQGLRTWLTLLWQPGRKRVKRISLKAVCFIALRVWGEAVSHARKTSRPHFSRCLDVYDDVSQVRRVMQMVWNHQHLFCKRIQNIPLRGYWTQLLIDSRSGRRVESLIATLHIERLISPSPFCGAINPEARV